MALVGAFTRFAACAAVAACAHAPYGGKAPPTVPVALQSDPPGAHCDLRQDGQRVAQVESCPGVAAVPSVQTDLEIVCRLPGHVGARRVFPPIVRGELEAEIAGYVPPTDAQVAGDAVKAAAFFMVGLPLLITPVGPLVGALAGIAAGPPAEKAWWGYEPVATIVLVPAVFASEASRDAFFDALGATIEAQATERRARVDANCFYHPCKPSDGPCADPVCVKRREQVAAQRADELAALPALRSQTRIATP